MLIYPASAVGHSVPDACNAPPRSSRHKRSAVAVVVCQLKMPGCLVAQGGGKILLVIIGNPRGEGLHQGNGAGPFLEPEALFFARAPPPLGVGMALRLVLAGKRVMKPQRSARLHERHRRRLTAVVTHEGH